MQTKEMYKAKKKAWYENNKEHVKEYTRAWRKANKDKVKEYNKRYYDKVMNQEEENGQN